MTIETGLLLVGLGVVLMGAGTLLWVWLYIRAFYALQAASGDAASQMGTFLRNRFKAMRTAFGPDQPPMARRWALILLLGGALVVLAAIGSIVAFVEPAPPG